MAAFWRMHVSPAKHSHEWLPRKCDYRTDTRTDRQKPVKVFPLCCYALQVTQKWMCLWNTNAPSGNIVQIGYFKFKGHGQGHKVIDLGDIWKGFRAPDNFWVQCVFTPYFLTQCWFSKFQVVFSPLYFFAMLKREVHVLRFLVYICRFVSFWTYLL